MIDYANRTHTRLTLTQRLWTHVLLWWQQGQIKHIRNHFLPRAQDEYDRYIISLTTLAGDKADLYRREQLVRDLRARL